MDSLQISTGEKRIPIVRDGVPAGELVFNPTDVIFAEKFYNLIGEFQQRLTQYQADSKALEAETATDADNLPVNAGERIALLRDACTYAREKIDYLFGAETSQMVFGDALSMETIQQFFAGIRPHFQAARAGKIAQYTNAKPKRAMK